MELRREGYGQCVASLAIAEQRAAKGSVQIYSGAGVDVAETSAVRSLITLS